MFYHHLSSRGLAVTRLGPGRLSTELRGPHPFGYLMQVRVNAQATGRAAVDMTLVTAAPAAAAALSTPLADSIGAPVLRWPVLELATADAAAADRVVQAASFALHLSWLCARAGLLGGVPPGGVLVGDAAGRDLDAGADLTVAFRSSGALVLRFTCAGIDEPAVGPSPPPLCRSVV
jgi:hypothetical protein